MNLDIATAPRKDSVTWRQDTVEWDDFVATLGTPADHRECGGYVFGRFTDETRDLDHLVSRSALVLDADHALPGLPERVAQLGYTVAWHTTWSSTPEAPRYRFIFPLAESIGADQYRATADAVVELLGDDWKQFDNTARDPSHFMWRPSTQDRSAYEAGSKTGELLTALEPVNGAATDTRERYIDDSPVRDPKDGLHYYAESAIAHELSDLRYLETEKLPNWDIGTYNAACNLIEFANSNWSGYTLERAEQDLMDNAPTDPGFGEREHRAKWESALGNIGGAGRRLPGEPTRDIWDQSPVLAHIRQAAMSRILSPNALLCYVLGRILAEVPPHVMLPPAVGPAAPLNVAFVVVAPPGGGKSAVAAVSGELLDLGQGKVEIGAGSGEGIVESFLEADPNNAGKKRLVSPPARILNIDEITRLTSVSARQGSTILTFIREAITGGALKTTNATADKNRAVEANTYRAVVFVGAQPSKTDVLLTDVDAGTPQRFCWVFADDPDLYREGLTPDDLPEWPGRLEWDAMSADLLAPHQVEYPDHIRRTIQEAAIARAGRRSDDPLGGHRSLVRLKVAAAVSLLHYVPRADEKVVITDQWWAVAGALMDWSDQVQQHCQAAVGRVAQARDEARGRAAVAEVQMVDSDRVSRTAQRIVSMATADGVTWGEISRKLSSNQRGFAEEALDLLVADGRLAVQESKQGNGAPMKTIRLVGGV